MSTLKTTDDKCWETISAMMDGEAKDNESWAWTADEADRERWESYHLIRDSLRQSAHQNIGGGLQAATLVQLSARLQQTVQDPVTPLVSAPSVVSPPVKTVAANQSGFKWFATAASVTAISVAVWQLLPHQRGAAAAESAQLAAPPATPPTIAPVAATQTALETVAPAVAEVAAGSAVGIAVPVVQKQQPANANGEVTQ